MLVAASNPCPCGYLGDPEVRCTCSQTDIIAYQSRLGGPLIDRIDIQIDVWRTSFDNVVHAGSDLTSSALRDGVLKAREFRDWRMSRLHVLDPHQAGDPIPDLIERNHIDKASEQFLKDVATRNSMSGRGIVRTLGIARTIADMDESEAVSENHMAEAFSLRLREVAKPR
jgi:magnesium chelatase family protein